MTRQTLKTWQVAVMMSVAFGLVMGFSGCTSGPSDKLADLGILRLGVLPFVYSGPSDQKDLTGDEAAGIIEEYFVNAGCTVTAQTGLEKIIEDLELNLDSLFTAPIAVKIGELAGVDGIVTGTYSYESQQYRARVKIVRISDSSVVFTASGDSVIDSQHAVDKIVVELEPPLGSPRPDSPSRRFQYARAGYVFRRICSKGEDVSDARCIATPPMVTEPSLSVLLSSGYTERRSHVPRPARVPSLREYVLASAGARYTTTESLSACTGNTQGRFHESYGVSGEGRAGIRGVFASAVADGLGED